jgi:hypothetical protein
MLRDGVELEAGEARRRKTEVGSWKTGVGRRKTEVGSWKIFLRTKEERRRFKKTSEGIVGSWKMEAGRRKLGDGRRK